MEKNQYFKELERIIGKKVHVESYIQSTKEVEEGTLRTINHGNFSCVLQKDDGKIVVIRNLHKIREAKE